MQFLTLVRWNINSATKQNMYSISCRVNQLHNVSCSHLSLFHVRRPPIYVPCSTNLSSIFSIPSGSHFLRKYRSSKFLLKCASLNSSGSLTPDPIPQIMNQKPMSILEILKQANSILPYVVLASTLVALVFPPSFTWFTSRYYAPALGYLMFAVGVNSSEKDFLEAFNRPAELVTAYVGQFVVKPLLGYLLCIISVNLFGLPSAIGAGIVLLACVSGAQLSSYATFLSDPQMAPLSIVMTSLSTISAVFVTPLLLLFFIGKRLPIDVKGMVFSITQIVLVPITFGLLLNRFYPNICNAIRPFLPPLSVLVAALSAGAPLALNIKSVKSPFGFSILLLAVAFHLSSFVSGYILSGFIFRDSPDVKPLQRTISFETGMQSSLLALALANKFFEDPVVVSAYVFDGIFSCSDLVENKEQEKTWQLKKLVHLM
ncbi:probable sodium/metabolite cotransporter BASS5, chloroplastic isoform X1 [Medicago truncatula]|uniref:probable sodium/metabolite cotransporter BASS5, chloroplastic isoform X1 n=1 Tax=Medicago truncatula TaxID=3880 RepID=UPI001967E889|nr:probable sodium/metabolite cotransporter BASS5, chloroplastic isoform X1 [Medicago truncatula]